MKKCFILLTLLFVGCATSKHAQTNYSSQNITVNGKLFGSLFQQRAAEYRALCYQAYNIARFRLDQTLPQVRSKPLAIVTDIDETVLDNSPYAVKQSLMGKDYEQQSWQAWTALAKADTVAGAHSFFKYAASKGVKIFYLTNRVEAERKGTLANLVQMDFPDVTDEQLILRESESSKESRRMAIAEKYDIVLLIGDNLADFSPLFDKKTPDERLRNAATSASEFGRKFIVLPNPAYGDWETSNTNMTLLPLKKIQ